MLFQLHRVRARGGSKLQPYRKDLGEVCAFTGMLPTQDH